MNKKSIWLFSYNDESKAYACRESALADIDKIFGLANWQKNCLISDGWTYYGETFMGLRNVELHFEEPNDMVRDLGHELVME